MTERHDYLISYDIADDKRRTSVFDTLQDNGDHLQYSVFICELSKLEVTRLGAQLSDYIHNEEDQVIVLDLGAAAVPLETALECIGKPYEPPSRVQIV